jgi:hypothetical protein
VNLLAIRSRHGKRDRLVCTLFSIWNFRNFRLKPWITRGLVLAALIVILPYGARAKDLELLMRYLVPAFLSQNFAAVCRVSIPTFLSDLPHGAGAVDEFSEQIKKTITDNLTSDEAATVVLVAANTALQAARNEMRKLSPEYPKIAPGPVSQWCHDDARPYILQVMQKNQREYGEFLKIIEKAKQ